jgi:hypothetical protein
MSDTTHTHTLDSQRSGSKSAGRVGGKPRVRVRPSYRTGSFEIFTYPHHSRPMLVAGAVWRWRVELLSVIMLIGAWVLVAYYIPADWPGWTVPLILAGIITLIGVTPVSRRFVVRRVWCVFSRHRVRKCFVQSRVMTHEGLLPLFMWARPIPVGDRLWLWLRPGLAARDVEGVADRIAAACWASAARVGVSTKRAAIVWVDIIRRDPLASPGLLTSPLLEGVDPEHFDTDAQVIPLPDRSTVTAATPVSAEIAVEDSAASGDPSPLVRGGMKRTGTRTTTPIHTTEPATAATVVGWSGRDVSDYV